jgi:two-component system, LytTR family, sensor histidine kinase AlgZ
MASINQNLPVPVLPDFRNLGVILRLLLVVIGMGAFAAVIRAASLGDAWESLTVLLAAMQPVLLLTILVLGLAAPALSRLPYFQALALIVVLVLAITLLAYYVSRELFPSIGSGQAWQWALFALVATSVLLFYFHLRGRALSPAISEARLQALQARIRPHFLFNSITAVLSLMRRDPQRAERALEDLAELFRVLMADNRQLTPLEDEVALTRQYLELEQLRLGDRLQVTWHIDKMPPDALVPPLVLQPLVENAVYHGIEPCAEPGELTINVYRRRDQVYMVLRNPYVSDGVSHRTGNKMALNNIKERLALHFDVEAGLKSQIIGTIYQVTINIPYRVQRAP